MESKIPSRFSVLKEPKVVKQNARGASQCAWGFRLDRLAWKPFNQHVPQHFDTLTPEPENLVSVSAKPLPG